MIPALNDLGLLPQGVWDCTLPDVAALFCTNPHRKNLWDGFLKFISAEVEPHGSMPVWIDGSFTRRKDYPEDIDVVLDLSDRDSSIAIPIAFSLWKRHDELKLTYHVDAWPKHPDIPNDLARFFQYAGPKVAAEIQVDEKQPKGILRVQL